MSEQIVRMARARAAVDEAVNKVLVLVADPIGAPGEERHRGALINVRAELVTAQLHLATRALKDFEDAARGK